MSTKTNFKRIAVVAVASLGLGVFTSIAPANAAVVVTAAATPWSATVAYAGTSTAAATQVVGGTATLTYSETVNDDGTLTLIGNIISTGVGTIASASTTSTTTADITTLGTDAGTETFPNTGVSRIAKAVNGNAVLVTYTVVVSSTTAGTQTLTASINDANGTPVSSKTATITWVAASATGVSAANSTMYVTPLSCATIGATVSADRALAATNGVPLVAAGTAINACIYARDGAGNAVTLTTTGVVSSTFGQSASTGAGTNGGQTVALSGANANLTGPTTINAVLIDTYGNVATLTTGIAYYGTLKTIKLSNISYAAAATATASTVAAYASYDALTASDVAVGVIGVQGFDAKGTPVNLGVSANSITTSTWTVDSDKVAGAPADRTKDTSSFTVRSVFPEATELGASSYGKNAAYVDCGSTKEKLTLTVWGKDSADAWVKSNSVDFYCSGAVDKVTVTASGTSVNVNVTDANGYPVSDRTSVALAASNGSVVAPSTKTTVNGQFATGATFIANSTAATSSVTAIVGTVAGTSAAIKGSGTSIEAQIASMLKLINKIMKRLNIR